MSAAHEPSYSEPVATGRRGRRGKLELYDVAVTCSCGFELDTAGTKRSAHELAERAFARHVERATRRPGRPGPRELGRMMGGRS